jgi:hypothetical protein
MISIKVDTRDAIAKFGPGGKLPAMVRANLRRVLPDLTKRLGAKVDDNLNSGLKTRRRLVVKKQMVENPTSIYGLVTTVSTREPYLLPLWLEDGTRPHVIAAKNAAALYFFWDKLGKFVSFKQVNHPGFKGIHYTLNAFQSMETEIEQAIAKAAREGAKEAGS